MRERAEELGAVFVKRRAEVVAGDGDQELRLSDACLAATPELGGVHPKLLIDATGRARLFARTLEIPARRGGRNDLAYFAHFENFDAGSIVDGQVVLSILDHGWSGGSHCRGGSQSGWWSTSRLPHSMERAPRSAWTH